MRYFSIQRAVVLIAALLGCMPQPSKTLGIPSTKSVLTFAFGFSVPVILGITFAMRADKHCQDLLKKADIPADTLKIINRKMNELKAYLGSPSLIQNYVEWVVKYPFKKLTQTHATLSDAIIQLNKTHCGVTDVKETIIDYLAGLHTSTAQHQKILCLCGGPGIGKTTIAESIAAALGKKFTKISFGALTSLSSGKSISENHPNEPGAIAKALINAETLNPVILLDELEKAPKNLLPELLELLDSTQNKAFKDTYLDFELDLSKVTFIASVNDVQALPSPLKDRMQIIFMHPYSHKERIEIASSKLIPEICKDFNFGPELQEKIQKLVEPLVEKLAPREYGVRNLKRALILAAEKYARQFLIQKERCSNEEIATITIREVLAAMNPELLQDNPATILNEKDCVGRVNGMYAQGSSGGGLLKLEIIAIPHGKGKLKSNYLHGDMSLEVQERIFAYVKSISSNYNIDSKMLTQYDFRFGDQNYAKTDGPSAGVAQTAAFISALTGRTIKQNFAVTGAIDMYGNVLPVGGYRDKILGTEQAGIKNIIVPECAKATIEALRKDFPTMNIFYVSTVPQALEILLNPAS